MRVFVDSNVLMYAAGQDHPNKAPSLAFLGAAQSADVQAVTSTEVLQEVLHRYHRLGRPKVAAEVYALTLQVCPEVLPVTVADTDRCLELLGRAGPTASVRDALHVAVMLNNDVDAVASFDTKLGAFGVTLWTMA